jgi:hypothetical protein
MIGVGFGRTECITYSGSGCTEGISYSGLGYSDFIIFGNYCSSSLSLPSQFPI